MNSIAYASRYSTDIDRKIVQESKTGFLADNVFRAQFVGAKTVIMPDLNLVGLGTYGRPNGGGGYPNGDVALAQTSYTLQMDRGRSYVIDAQDADESGVADLIGKTAAEITRTVIVPEMDAYNLSKLAKVASDNSHETTYNASTAVGDLLGAINGSEAANAYNGDEMIAFVDPTMYNILMTSSEITRMIITSDFKQGDVNVKVKSLNGVAIIPVAADRMKSAFTFNAGAASNVGGYTPAAGAKNVRAIVLPKKSASFVKKVDKVRIFTPEQNKDADAYVLDVRVYYDLFVKKSHLGTVFSITAAGASV